MSMKKKRRYRGISIYIKPGKRNEDPDNTEVAGEINFGATRKHVPQSKTVEAMMFKARRIIDKKLDTQSDVIADWFKMKLV